MKKISLVMGLILIAVILVGRSKNKTGENKFIESDEHYGDLIGQETLKHL